MNAFLLLLLASRPRPNPPWSAASAWPAGNPDARSYGSDRQLDSFERLDSRKLPRSRKRKRRASPDTNPQLKRVAGVFIP